MRYVIAGFALLLCPFTALAQSAGPAVTSTTEPATVSFVTGFSVGSDEVGPLAGGTLSAGVNSWLSLEGSAGFADRGPGVNGVYALASAVFNLRPASNRIVPFASVGGGLYHAEFDMGNREMFGQLGSQVEEMMFGFLGEYQAWLRMHVNTTGPQTVRLPVPRQMPQFYANRIGTMMLPENGRWGRRSFTDPATSIGGGAVIRLSERVVLRPDARAILIFNDGDTNAVGLVNLGIGFRF
jgi:hypothetical protein